MRLPVLCYHAMNVHGSDYASNDHVAFEADLERLAAEHRVVVPLHEAVAAHANGAELPKSAVAVSFDDGSWFDWHDLEHPTLGLQRSFATAMRAVRSRFPRGLHATSFVIVSPEARATLDRTCLVGRGWWTDDWWAAAQAEGLMAIESHSWDHNHETLPRAGAEPRGTFRSIDDFAKADAQIRVASDWLAAHVPSPRPRLFAYPYGEANDFLVRDYFPNHRDAHRCAAAFTTEPKPMTRDDDRWTLPRYVCGRDWQSPDGLLAILADAR